RNGLALLVEHTCRRVGAEPGKGPDVARQEPHGVVGRLVERGHARVGRMSGGAVEAPVGVGATGELGVHATPGTLIERADGCRESGRIDTETPGQFLGRVAAHNVAGVEIGLEACRSWRRGTEAPAPDGGMIADVPALGL